LWLWRLNQVVTKLRQETDVDWLGIYKKVRKKHGDEVLWKLAYYDEPSRAEFPLTKEFAVHSNNSTVGLTGQAILIQDLAEYKGPYYKCDGRVKSEFCCPIIDLKGEIVGIIDAESFRENFFDDMKLLQITKVCSDLGVYL
jgi:putative methionine-R-sulfoxide reductase with GAF domain